MEGLSLRACTVSFVISKDTLAVLRALARRPPLCPSVLSVLLCVLRNLRFPLHRASCIFVVLREPSCRPRRVNLPHSPSGSIRRALVARPVAVEGLALRACTVSFVISNPFWQSSCAFVVLRAPSCQPRRANLPHTPSAPPVAPQGRSVLCSLFSVLRSLFSGARQRPSAFLALSQARRLAMVSS